MRIMQIIHDARIRSRVLALAAERRLPVPRCEGPWVIFEAVYDPEPVDALLEAAGVPVPPLAGAPKPKGAVARRSSGPRKRS